MQPRLLIAAAGSAVLILGGLIWACGSSGSNAAPTDAGAVEDQRPQRSPPSDQAPEDASVDTGPPETDELGAIYANDAQWKSIPLSAACDLREGVVEPDPFVPRVWTPCAGGLPGCASMPTTLAMSPRQAIEPNATAGAWINGDFYILFELYTKTNRLTQVFRLSDGKTVAAVVVRRRGPNECIVAGYGGPTPLLLVYFDGATQKTRFGRVSSKPNTPIAWHSTWVDWPIGRDHFMTDQIYGSGSGGDLVYLNGPTDSEARSLLGHAERVQGLDDQVVWTGYGTGRVRSYTPTTGAIDLVPVPPPRDAMGVRISSTRLVWITGEWPGDQHTDVRFHWSPRARATNEVSVHDGPLVNIRSCVNDMYTEGDWAVTTGCAANAPVADPDGHRVFLWHITTGELFEMRGRPGRRIKKLFGLSPTQLVFADVAKEHDQGHQIEELVRIDLASVPSLLAAWQ